MSSLSEISVIIASLNPTDRLCKVVSGLAEEGFCDIIVVNDGSSAEHTGLFEKISGQYGCVVLTHSQNMGKGAALKTAFAYFAENRCGQQGAIVGNQGDQPDVLAINRNGQQGATVKNLRGQRGVVTVDGDGQHLPADVAKCARMMLGSDDSVIIGGRDFGRAGVPVRNSLGNRISAFAMRIMFGLRLRDTQTGLRGIPSRYVPLMLEIEGSRFEYETNMLLRLNERDIPLIEVPIETVYEDGSNERSNYRPFQDSMAIAARLAKYSVSSVLCFAVDIGAFWAFMEFFRGHLGVWAIPCCAVAARLISSFLNFSINKRFVFKQKDSYARRLLRYYLLVTAQMLVAAGGLWLISLLFGGEKPTGFIALLKILLDFGLFFASFHVQQKWVFRGEK